MAEGDYLYQNGITVGDKAAIVHFNKIQTDKDKEAKMDIWCASLATDEEDKAKVWADLSKTPEDFCQSILFGIMANPYVLKALMSEHGAKRIFGPKNVHPKAPQATNNDALDFGNLQNCEVAIDYESKVEPQKVQAKSSLRGGGAARVRSIGGGGASRGGGGGAAAGPGDAPARHFNTRIVGALCNTVQVPMTQPMAEDPIFFTAAPGTKFPEKKDSEVMEAAMEGLASLLPAEYREAKPKTDAKHKEDSKPKTDAEPHAIMRKVPMIIQVTEHDGLDDETGEQVKASSMEMIEFFHPVKGFKRTYPELTYSCTRDILYKVNVQNTTYLPNNGPAGRFEIESIYEHPDGTCSREERINLDSGEVHELQDPIKKEEGDEPDACVLCCADTDIPVAKLVFKLRVHKK